MSRFYFILFKILKSHNKPISKISNYSIFITNSLCIFFISLILSVSEGFKFNIIDKITDIDGVAIIYDDIEKEYFDKTCNFVDVNINYGFIKTPSVTENVKIISLESKDIIAKDYIVNLDTSSNGIIVGRGLYDKISTDASAFLFIYDNGTKYPIGNVRIAGYFNTEIDFFDDYYIYADNSVIDIIGNSFTYVYSDLEYFPDNETINKDVHYWFDNYSNLFSWLNQFDKPINLLLYLILIIALISNVSAFHIDVINRKDDFFLYKIMGMKNYYIHLLFLSKHLLLSVSGALIGCFISYIFIRIDSMYHFIKIPPDIYYTSFLPYNIQLSYYVYPILFLVCLSVFICFIFNYFIIKR